MQSHHIPFLILHSKGIKDPNNPLMINHLKRSDHLHSTFLALLKITPDVVQVPLHEVSHIYGQGGMFFDQIMETGII